MDGLPEDLKCPVCWEVPESNIYQCSNGHIVCSSCSFSLTECPCCRIKYETHKIRNRSLEQALDLLGFVCPNKILGCQASLRRQDIAIHSRSCPYRWVTSVQKIAQSILHLLNVHGSCISIYFSDSLPNKEIAYPCEKLGYSCNFLATQNSDIQTVFLHLQEQHSIIGTDDPNLKIHLEGFTACSPWQRRSWTPVVIHSKFDKLENAFILLSQCNGDGTISFVCLELNRPLGLMDRSYFMVYYRIDSVHPSQVCIVIFCLRFSIF